MVERLVPLVKGELTVVIDVVACGQIVVKARGTIIALGATAHSAAQDAQQSYHYT